MELDTAGKFHSKFGSSSDGSMWTTQRLDNVSSPRDVSTDGQSVVLIENGYPQPVVIWRSTDSTSWAEVYRGTQPSDPVTAFGNGRYVVVQSGSTDPASVLTSTNGTGWTTHAGFTEFGFNDLIFANGRFYGAERGHEFSGARVFSSSDGVQWTAHPTGFHPTLGNLAAGPQGLFAFGAGGVILHSPWDLVLTAPERALNGIMRVYVSGPQGANVQLQRGTTPTDWADWQMVTLNDAPVQVEDAEVAASSQRFYRAFTR